jgi:NADH:ubiquinone oxidoreductase subunit D
MSGKKVREKGKYFFYTSDNEENNPFQIRINAPIFLVLRALLSFAFVLLFNSFDFN